MAPTDNRRPVGTYRSLRAPGTWLLTLLAVTFAVNVQVVAAEVAALGWLGRVLRGTAQSEAPLLTSMSRYGLLSVLQFLLLAVTGPLFLAWFHRAYRNLPAVGVVVRRFGTGWAVGGWFVPLLNLFRPKQIADELWRDSDSGAVLGADGGLRRGAMLAVHT